MSEFQKPLSPQARDEYDRIFGNSSKCDTCQGGYFCDTCVKRIFSNYQPLPYKKVESSPAAASRIPCAECQTSMLADKSACQNCPSPDFPHFRAIAKITGCAGCIHNWNSKDSRTCRLCIRKPKYFLNGNECHDNFNKPLDEVHEQPKDAPPC